PGVAMGDLERDAADGARDDGLRLPEGLRDRETEALAERLLDDDGRRALERVDLDVRHRRQLDDVDVRIAAGALATLDQDLGALRVVGRRAADQEQLTVVVLLRQ